MAGEDYAREFSGLDDATVSERLPKLKTGAYRLRVLSNKRTQNPEYGVSFVTEVEVIQSTRPDYEAGKQCVITITGYDDRTQKGDNKRGYLKAQIAACIGLPHTEKQNYGGIAGYALQHGILVGAIFQAVVLEAKSRAGHDYLQITYSPDPENPRTLAAISAELAQGGRRA